MSADDLLAEVRAAAEHLAQAEARRRTAVAAAFTAGLPRTAIAEAAGMTRDGVYKLVKTTRDTPT
ncbi:hypothetical protein ACFQE5_22425 [Pseudonocardia hispaniensis]|uniref:Uncharacterized protein n=1 Tax=Pseudonocardia hispaniensis TaxID=904933 RepID=A0ABW1J7V9_9PSEU